MDGGCYRAIMLIVPPDILEWLVQKISIEMVYEINEYLQYERKQTAIRHLEPLNRAFRIAMNRNSHIRLDDAKFNDCYSWFHYNMTNDADFREKYLGDFPNRVSSWSIRDAYTAIIKYRRPLYDHLQEAYAEEKKEYYGEKKSVLIPFDKFEKNFILKEYPSALLDELYGKLNSLVPVFRLGEKELIKEYKDKCTKLSGLKDIQKLTLGTRKRVIALLHFRDDIAKIKSEISMIHRNIIVHGGPRRNDEFQNLGILEHITEDDIMRFSSFAMNLLPLLEKN